MPHTINLDPKNPFNAFGLPPGGFVSDHMIYNTMPMVEIFPGEPYLTSGLTVFSIEEKESVYKAVLAQQGFTAPYPPKFAYIADSFPSDSFTNEYGETFLHKITDVASSGFGQLAQMTGTRSATEGLKKIAGGLTAAGEKIEGLGGMALKGLGYGANVGANTAESIKSALKSTPMLAGVGNVLDKMLAGARVDFPQVWRNSGFH
jgi:hypothetical protein